MPKSNRRKAQDNKTQEKVISKPSYADKVSLFANNDWKLDWFIPSEAQQEIVSYMNECDLTIGDAPSGTGKTSTVVWKALNDLKQGHVKRIVFVKNPTEAGDDMIGFLKGEKDDKLKAHFHETRRIFLNFISKGKLESDESSGKIEFTIPNYLLGATVDDSWFIIDEGQTMSPNTIKLLLERAGLNTHVALLGDSKQRYSIKKREDGFTDFINKVTSEDEEGFLVSNQDLVGYVQMTTDENRRSPPSKLITELYE